MDTKQDACDPCLLDATIQYATGFCVVCVERLCDDCVKFHGKNKATRKHKILTDDDVPIDTDTFRLLAESAFCKAHPEIEIQFKCEEHDEYICGICARKAHRHCERMEEINSELDENYVREECQLTINNSRDLSDTLSVAKKVTEEIIEKALQGKQKTIGQRRILFQSIRDLITKLETKTYSEIDILHDDQTLTLRNDIEKTSAIEQQQMKDQALIDAALKYANPKTMQIVTSRTAKQLEITRRMISDNGNSTMQARTINKANFLQTLIKHLEKEIENKSPENETANEHLLENYSVFNEAEIHGSDEYASCMQEVEDMIHISQSDGHLGETSLQDCQAKRDTKLKGRTKLYEAREKVIETPSIMQPKLKEPVSLIDKSLELVYVHKYDDYEEGFPSDCVVLRDGRLVTIGHRVGSPKISVYNTNMVVICESKLDHEPYQICVLGDREVAITYFDYKRIDKFLILKDQIERCGGFHTELYARGITKHGNDIAVLFTDKAGDNEVNSRNDTVEIQIRKNDGKINDTIGDFRILRELSIDNPSCILSLPNKNEILVGDKTHLRCFNMDGDCPLYFRSYKDHALKDILGFTADGEGNILVCGSVSNNVYQLGANDYRQNRIIIEHIHEPLCIAYDALRERIFVGCGDHFIRVFQFV